MESTFFVFFRPGESNLSRANDFLRLEGLDVAEEDNGLIVGLSSSPQFKVTYSEDPSVAVAARKLSKGTKYAKAMGECTVRFEVYIDDLDEALDEINTLMEVEVALQESCNGYIYLPWNDMLSASLADGDTA